MRGFLIWGAFSVGVAAFCIWRPHPARIFVGLFFGAMGLGIHEGLIATNPQSYVDFAADAPWAIYRDIGTWLTEPSPLAFGIFMLCFETVTAALILSRGRAVTWGRLGAIVFLVGSPRWGWRRSRMSFWPQASPSCSPRIFPPTCGPCCAATDAPRPRPQHGERLCLVHTDPVQR
jgi:hypothetical protein